MDRDKITNDDVIRSPAFITPFGKIDATYFQEVGFPSSIENIFADIFAALPAGIAVLDDQQRVIGYNPAFAQLLNISNDNFHKGADTAWKFFRPDGSSMPLEEFPAMRFKEEQRLLQGIAVGLEKENDCFLWIEACAVPLTNSSSCCFIVIREITERIERLEELRRSEIKFRHLSEQLEAILDHIPGPVFYKDKNNSFIRVNKCVADAHNKEKTELEGISLFDLYPKEQAEAYYQDDLEVLRSGIAKLNIEETWKTTEGLRWVNTSKIPFIDENGSTIGIIGIAIDITERKQSESRINDLILRLEEEKEQAQAHALTDGLTGIANRRHFDNTLQGEMNRLKRTRSPLSLIMLDIDFFKSFNDRHGHVAGDSCLKTVATVVKESVGRASDFVARYGGEEFAVIMPETKNRGAQVVAERIRQAVANFSIFPRGTDASEQITVSLGVVTVYPGRTELCEKIVDLADAALYHAKTNGRNRYEVAIHGDSLATPTEGAPGFVELSWHVDFNSGNATIDDQHKRLFKTSSQLLSAISAGKDKQECLALIKNLLEETQQHFHDEENIIRLHKYPATEDHCRIHRGLMAKAGELSEKFKHGYMTIGELFTFLANDIIWHHMYVEDRKFFSCF